MRKRLVYLLCNDEACNIMKEFEDVLAFPHAALDGCRIGIKDPADFTEDYVNKQKRVPLYRSSRVSWWQILISGYFSWEAWEIPWCQSFSKFSVIPRTFKKIIFASHIIIILVDSAYTLAEWLMKPYFDRGNLNDVELRFNFPLTRCRVVVENIFGRLKGQFQCLLSAVVLSCITFSIIANQSSLKNGYNELTHSYFMIATLQDFLGWESIRKASQPAFIYSKLKIRTLEQGAKYVQR